MANLTVIPEFKLGGYYVFDVDAGVLIGFFQSQNIANDFAARGDNSLEAFQQARAADIQVSGGIATEATPLPVNETRQEVVPISQIQTAPTAVSNPPNPQVDRLRTPEEEAADDARIRAAGAITDDPQVDRLRTPEEEAADDARIRAAGAITDDPQANRFVFDDNGELIPADSARAQEIIARESRVQNIAPQPISDYTTVFNVETGLYDVVDLQTGEVVLSGRSEQDATLFAEEANTVGVPDARGIDITRQEEFSTAIQSLTEAQRLDAQAQWEREQQRKQANDGDWRVRLRLAPNANYLYNAEEVGPLLQPLKITDGVVFPYTPQIVQAYRANYSNYDLTHSNYRGFFYQNSYLDDIQINATFTAQDTAEANYLLAVITFFKSVTKMFYGQDGNRGTPPPMVFLQGLGRYQFNLNPCVVSQFNYTLPDDIDYIRAQSPNINGTNLLSRRARQALPTNPFSSALSRIENLLKPQLGNGLTSPAPPAAPTLGKNSPTYVPTKIDISLILHPMQSRQQVSQEFSLRDYANGRLIQKGFW
jgi:hypothetical protein